MLMNGYTISAYCSEFIRYIDNLSYVLIDKVSITCVQVIYCLLVVTL